MKLDIFTFCDFAQESNGKMTIVGTFNVLQLNKVPSVYQNFYVAIRATFAPEDEGEHTLRLTFKHEDSGYELLPALELKTETVRNDGMFSSMNLPFNAPFLNFEKEGKYVCTVTIDDVINQSIILYVKTRT